MNTSTKTQKEKALSFQNMIVSGKVREAYEAFVSEDFRHHNVHTKAGREALLKGMEENAGQFPDKVFEVQRVVEEGDLIVIHSRMHLAPEGPELAPVHIYRFEGGLIVEMWDVGQAVPKESFNEDGAF